MNLETQPTGLTASAYDFKQEFLRISQESVIKIAITPEFAKYILANHNKLNRPVKAHIVRKYVRLMKLGRWVRASEAIGFDNDNQITSGQHRLIAVVESGVTLDFILVFGCDPESRGIDDAASRSIRDKLTYTGTEVSTKEASISSCLVFGVNPVDLIDTNDRQEVIEAYRTEIRNVTTVIPKSSKVAIAPILACVCRAMAVQDPVKCTRFLQIMHKPELAGVKEMAARQFSIHVQTNKFKGAKARTELYKKCQNALVRFFDGKPFDQIKGLSEDVFPLKPSLAI